MKKHRSLSPFRVCLFLLSCLTALAALCMLLPETIGNERFCLHMPQLSRVLDIQPCTMDSDSISQQDTILQQVDTTIRAIDTTDMHIYLSAFYRALSGADTTAVRVIHYGDSQIEEDRLTLYIRRALQSRYGGGGVGILPLHQTIPTSTVRQRITMNETVQSANEGPQRYIVYGPPSMHRDNSLYGVLGQVAVMDTQLVAGSQDILFQVSTANKEHHSECYFNRVRLLTKGNVHATIGKAIGRNGELYIVPDSTTSVAIRFTGTGDIYGISLECDRGVIVDNIPMRGCSGAVFTNISASLLQNYFDATNTKLIILQFGGNTIPYIKNEHQMEIYVSQMRDQVRYLQRLAPDCSMLFVGPSDMIERRDGELQTYRMIPLMDSALHQMAIDEQIGYFSLYHHMGGSGSMLQWYEQDLAASDYIHFTRSGAAKAGEMLSEWIMKQHN